MTDNRCEPEVVGFAARVEAKLREHATPPAMTEYTPTVEEAREGYSYYATNMGDWDFEQKKAEGRAEFDRMIAGVERAAAVKALREAATAIEHDELYSDDRDGWAVDLVAGRAIELESGEQP